MTEKKLAGQRWYVRSGNAQRYKHKSLHRTVLPSQYFFWICVYQSVDLLSYDYRKTLIRLDVRKIWTGIHHTHSCMQAKESYRVCYIPDTTYKPLQIRINTDQILTTFNDRPTRREKGLMLTYFPIS